MEILSTELIFFWNDYENFLGKPANPYWSSQSIVMFKSVVILLSCWFVWSCTKLLQYLQMLQMVSQSFFYQGQYPALTGEAAFFEMQVVCLGKFPFFGGEAMQEGLPSYFGLYFDSVRQMG